MTGHGLYVLGAFWPVCSNFVSLNRWPKYLLSGIFKNDANALISLLLSELSKRAEELLMSVSDNSAYLKHGCPLHMFRDLSGQD